MAIFQQIKSMFKKTPSMLVPLLAMSQMKNLPLQSYPEYLRGVASDFGFSYKMSERAKALIGYDQPVRQLNTGHSLADAAVGTEYFQAWSSSVDSSEPTIRVVPTPEVIREVAVSDYLRTCRKIYSGVIQLEMCAAS